MYEMSEADWIWNRACGNDPLRDLPGDRALTDLLIAHGCTMNGGVLHALECLTVQDLSNAVAGYRYYGLDAVALLFDRSWSILAAGNSLDDDEQALDSEYDQAIPSDSFLVERFEERLKMCPSDFAPLRTKDKQ